VCVRERETERERESEREIQGALHLSCCFVVCLSSVCVCVRVVCARVRERLKVRCVHLCAAPVCAVLLRV